MQPAIGASDRPSKMEGFGSDALFSKSPSYGQNDSTSPLPVKVYATAESASNVDARWFSFAGLVEELRHRVEWRVA